jgi:site-specific DNA-methyltransferase (adenine-specific)
MEEMNKPIYDEDGITLYCGDCIEILPGIESESIDLILTDPPYGIDYQSNMRIVSDKFDKLKNDDNSKRLEAYERFFKILKNDCVSITFCSFKNYAEDYMKLIRLGNIKNCIIWDKGGGGIGDLEHSLLTDYEMAIVTHKGNCPIRGKRDGSVWKKGKVNPNLMQHPTEKPTKLIEKMIEKFSDKTNLILDPFCGSGTTLVAAKRLGRKAIGIEISEKYCKIAIDRLRQRELF